MIPDADGSLADLFSADEEPRRAEEAGRDGRRRTWIGRLFRTVLLVGGASAITIAVLRSQGIKVSWLLVVVAFLALRLLLLAVSEVAPPPVPRRPRGGTVGAEDGQAGTDTLRAAVRRWERQLDWSKEDGERFSRIVLPALTELTDERLRLRHGITRASDSRRAREIMGEPLWGLLHDPGRKAPKPKDMASYVDALERI